jgi:hypothetical protein
VASGASRLRVRLYARDLDVLGAFREMSPDERRAICAGLARLPIDGTKLDLIAAVEDAWPSEGGAVAPDFIASILSLQGVRVSQGWVPTDAIAASISAELTDEPDTQFQADLSAVLSAPLVAQLGRAADVLYDQERVFQGARMLTDMRPFFGDDVEDGALGTVLVHTLRVDALVDGDLASYYFALDEQDLEIVFAVLERARKKSVSVRAMLDKAGMPTVTPDRFDD